MHRDLSDDDTTAPGGSFRASHQLEVLTRRLLELLGHVTGLESTYLTRIDWDGNAQDVLFARNTGTFQIPEGLHVDWADTLCRRALESGPRYTTNVAVDFPGNAASEVLGITTWVTVPVAGGDGAVFGTLCGASSDVVGVTDNSMQVMEALAEMIALHLERDRHAEALRDQTRRDPLTGLGNRVRLLEALEAACTDTEVARTALLFVDLDDFKAVNDTGGHAHGDQVLRAIASRLGQISRAGDVVARLSGDEFAVLLCDVEGAGGAAAAAQRVIAALSEPIVLDTSEVTVQASVGVAVRDRFSVDGAMLLRNADMAMYAAKRDGKGRWRLFDDDVHRLVAGRADMIALLRDAGSAGQFRVHYQPIVHLASGKVTGVEALLRWQHPRRGLLGAGEFIDLAEEAGLTGAIGEWVLGQACRDIGAWNDAHPGQRRYVSVNVSARDFDDRLPALVADALDGTGLAPSELVIEITESLDLADGGGDVIGALHALGVRVALDDFGTGYSSLSYLRRLHVDIVKIDRSFVHPDTPGDNDEAIMAAIVDLCAALDLDVVAEGVEGATEAAWLAELGVGYGQGYHLGRPGPLHETAVAERDAVHVPSRSGHGPHVCLTFRGRDRFVTEATAFLAEGLVRGERLLYVADADTDTELLADIAGLGDTGALVASGTLGVHRIETLYAPGGHLDGDAQLATYRRLAEEAVAAGYTGLRVAADATALAQDPACRGVLVDYETRANDLAAQVPLHAMCAYDVDVVGDICDIAGAHPAVRCAHT